MLSRLVSKKRQITKAVEKVVLHRQQWQIYRLLFDEEDDIDGSLSSIPFDDFEEDPPENGDGAGLALTPFADNYPLDGLAFAVRRDALTGGFNFR